MEIIKLVIWDLDDTFWKGTLSEEEVEFISANIEVVKELSRRGIINAVASKNSFEKAKKKLVECDAWDYFVFSSINWEPKGQQVKEIIEKTQLRNVNVLFMDDNHLNLEEVKFYNPGINVASPDFIQGMTRHPGLSGKDDSGLSRLKQYKILEQKELSRATSTNEEFLRTSEIAVEFVADLVQNADRIEELINRSNQLNFTKIRLSQTEVAQLLADKERLQGAIAVTDRFGKYGIVGYYCLSPDGKKLEHFVFSCRVMNVGIEQFIYAHLGFPELNVVGEVNGELSKVERPNWISIVNSGVTNHFETKERAKVLFKGGCDLSQMLHYIGGKHISVVEETNYVSRRNFPINAEHTQVLLDLNQVAETRRALLMDTIPFVDEQFFNTKVFNTNYDVLIYSVLMDYTQELYVHRDDNFLIPFGGYQFVLTDENQHRPIIRSFELRGINLIDEKFLRDFTSNYKHIGQITPGHFKQNLTKLRSRIPAKIPIILVNGTEVDWDYPLEKGASVRHHIMNLALDEFIASSSNCFLLDLRKIVVKRSQIKDNIRHYNREVYFQLALELTRLLRENTGIRLALQRDTFFAGLKRKVKGKINRYLRKTDL